jgi:hypothetical protein
MIITKDSHTDHHLLRSHINFILEKFGDREAFFIATVRMPSRLSSLPIDLHGPIVGERPIREDEVFYARRNGRSNISRLVKRAPKKSREITVIGGPHNGHVILYTAYGGPLAPREPTDPTLPASERRVSEDFWSEHALGVSRKR